MNDDAGIVDADWARSAVASADRAVAEVRARFPDVHLSAVAWGSGIVDERNDKELARAVGVPVAQVPLPQRGLIEWRDIEIELEIEPPRPSLGDWSVEAQLSRIILWAPLDPPIRLPTDPVKATALYLMLRASDALLTTARLTLGSENTFAGGVRVAIPAESLTGRTLAHLLQALHSARHCLMTYFGDTNAPKGQ